MINQSKRERTRQKQRFLRIRTTLTWSGISILVLAIVGVLVWKGVRPEAGEAVSLPADAGIHVETNIDPGPYPSDPPAGGRHFAQEFEAGFYEATDPQTLQLYPEGYLNHNLEHGYIIFWYNCDVIITGTCDDLKSQIHETMEGFDSFKLIAFPWESLTQPVVMTSWGRIQHFQTFDPRVAGDFIRANLNRAPEPDAP